jgi:hypothetical protein
VPAALAVGALALEVDATALRSRPPSGAALASATTLPAAVARYAGTASTRQVVEII